MAKPRNRSPLMVRVWAELGAGRLSEDYVSDPKVFVDGYIEGGHIYINPAPALVETCIHEILHRLHPLWKEEYVANRTTYLLRRMTDQEIQTFYEEYQRRVKKRKRRIRDAGGVRPGGRGVDGAGGIDRG